MLSSKPEKSVHIKTFGCQMNVFDSNRMENILLTAGFRTEANPREASLILINTCAIRDKSEQKVLSLLGQMKALKEKHPSKVIAVSGCVGSRLGRTLLQKVPHLDLVIGPDSIDRISDLVEHVLKTGDRCVQSEVKEEGRSYSQPLLISSERSTKPSEFLTIVKGCDHFCTYCIVPFVRGRERSRPLSEILDDVRRLVARGTKEVIFLGQNINTYGKGTGESLSVLLEQANKVKGLRRIRYLTSHPRDLSKDLISQFGMLEKLCPQLHLPFQSGSDSVLKRMSRLYTRNDYLNKIKQLRESRSDMALSTDVIVGFPGETESDFCETLEVLREVRFNGAFLFKYSPRPGTRAFSSEKEVGEEEKDERLKRAQEIAFSIIDEENKKWVGRVVSCLVESKDKKGRYFSGKSATYQTVHVKNVGPASISKIIDVRIEEANGSNLKGYCVDVPPARSLSE